MNRSHPALFLDVRNPRQWPAGRRRVQHPVQPPIQPPRVEAMERRQLLSASLAFGPHDTIRGETMPQWAADWWKSVLQTPVYAADGKTVINPAFDPTGAQAFRGDQGKAFFLSGFISLSTTGAATSVHRVATLPSDTPILFPVLNVEFDNSNTAKPDGSYPGDYSVSELRHQAAVETAGTTELHASVDGKAVPNLSSYRQKSPVFSYTLPPKNNINQVFSTLFGVPGLATSGPVSPAVADGYYVMLRGLAPGHHRINFGGTAKATDVSAPFQIDITYDVTVLAGKDYRAARPDQYRLSTLATVGGAAAGAEKGTYSFDFEPGDINNSGQAMFVADTHTASVDGEGAFVADAHGTVRQLFRVGEPAPGGGTFGGFGSFSPASINDKGEVASAFDLAPGGKPTGNGGGLFRYSATGVGTALVVPGVTHAPGGGTFNGTGFRADINNAGQVAFTGMVQTQIGPGGPAGLGDGVFVIDRNKHVTAVASPGGAAPGGRKFDFAQNPTINDRGDVAFGAHLAGDPVVSLGQTLPDVIFAAESIYLRTASTGKITSIAHQGAAIPASAGGGTFAYAFGPVVNNEGDVVFVGAIQPDDPQGTHLGLFLWSKGKLRAVARPGDALPGGGHLASASFFPGNYDLNHGGQVVFNAATREGGQGLYAWSHGRLSLVAKAGATVLPDGGVIAAFDTQDRPTPLFAGGAYNNDKGQVLFGAKLTDGRKVLLVATEAT